MSRAWFAVLCALALAQMVASLLHVELASGLALATVASPAPKVFTSMGGLESFSSQYDVLLTDGAGHTSNLRLDAVQTDAMAGPYNRRNPYGAALVFAPQLSANPRTQAMFRSVVAYGVCGHAPLLRELGFDPGPLPRHLTIRHRPRPGTHTELPLITDVSCR